VGRFADSIWRTTGRIVSVPAAVDVPEGRMVDLPGRGSTFVVDTGPSPEVDGRPTLVLLHALACTGLLTWYPAIEALRRNYRVVTFDQRWHGQGIRSPRFTLEDCADDTVAVADALGIDEFVAVGYSMGSLVAQLAWRRHPGRVRGLVLCATTSRFTQGGREPAALRVISTRLAQAAAWRLRSVALAETVTVPTAEHNRWALAQLRMTKGSGIAGAVAVISRFDSSAWIGDVDVPAAVVVTAEDRVIPPVRQHWLARQIADAAVYEIPAGHASVVMNTTAFIPALQAACASVSARVSTSTAPARR
jgi:diacylglycerol O-acyltransferase